MIVKLFRFLGILKPRQKMFGAHVHQWSKRAFFTGKEHQDWSTNCTDKTKLKNDK
jgi:hypothetical protein